MTTDPFDFVYICHFDDETRPTALPNESLQRILACNWSRTSVADIVTSWLARGAEQTVLEPAAAEQLLCQAIELALLFLQHNFTGPFVEQQELVQDISEKMPHAHEQLMENGVELNPNVKLPELLLLSKQMLTALLAQWPTSLVLRWWRLRLLCMQQKVLDELTSNLYEQVKLLAEQLSQQIELLPDTELQALLYLELANAYLLFERTQKCEQLLQQMCARLQVKLNVQGLLGVRTKFQQKPLPQLCLQVQQTQAQALRAAQTTNGAIDLPKLLLLEDDTRLERIRFVQPEDNDVMTLPSVLQALVLTQVHLLKRAQPKDRLADEELEPYIQTLLYQQCGPLQVRQTTLLLNCVQESQQRRTVERSWKQCEEAVKLLQQSDYTLPQRYSYAFAALLPTSWQVQWQLCELQFSLGMIKTALDIYLQTQAWQQVIDCYTRLQLRHKAAEIIQQQLQQKPTVLLHCLLGDATDDVQCYATAWQFSKQQSARAQAHWGNYYYYRANYAEAIPHYELSLQINTLQEQIWLRLGYAALTLERWQLAVRAYITYTHLEPYCFESWNNLAKALIKLGDKERAHKILNEALKCNYNNWKVWENFMLVSLDTAHFEDAINAYNRLIELKTHFSDLEVLCLLVHAIATGKPDAKGQTSARLHKKANELVAQQCIKHGNEPKVWELAAALAPTPLNKAQKLNKCYRAHTSKELDWRHKQPYVLKALQLCQQLCELTLQSVEEHAADETQLMIQSQLSSARLAAQSCVNALQQTIQDWPDCQALLLQIQQLQERLTLLLSERMKA